MPLFRQLSILSLLLFAYSCHGQPDKPSQEGLQVLLQAKELCEENHLNPKEWNKDLCMEFLQEFIAEIDQEKMLFSRKDLTEWEEILPTLQKAPSEGERLLVDLAAEDYKSALNNLLNYYETAAHKEIAFSKKEQLETMAEKRKRPEKRSDLLLVWEQELRRRWQDQLFKEQLIADHLDFDELKKSSFEKVKARLIQQTNTKLNSIPNFLELLASSYLQVQDHQSYYMSLESKSDWTAAYTREFVGIGARIELEKDYPKISELIIGGPAWKAGLLQAGDVIMRIADSNGELRDVGGQTLDETIAMLKGEKGSEVAVKVLRDNQTILNLGLERGAVQLETASSFVLSDKAADLPVAYLRLPRFYMGNEGAAMHVLQELRAINEKGIEGLILDLRNNQGGSAREAAEIIGYFLEDALAMQSRYRDGEVSKIWNEDGQVIYNGHLLIMTNGRSSSASELTAGTLRDYRRALLVGSQQTYGKGSIQRFFDVMSSDSSEQAIGQVKLTVGNFFTASGRSPQYNGIVPDLVLPDNFNYVPSGERAGKYALQAVSLERQDLTQSVNTVRNIARLRDHSETRTGKSPAFQKARERGKMLAAELSESSRSLDFSTFVAEQKKRQEEALRIARDNGTIASMQAEVIVPNNRGDKEILKLQRERLREELLKDPYIQECVFILNDMM